MRKNILTFFLLVFLGEINHIEAKIENKIILKIENEIITNYEIKNKILTTLFLAGDPINQENINKLKKKSLESLIQVKIKKLELVKYNIKEDDQQINSYLNAISDNNIIGLKENFRINKLDFELFLNELKVQSKWQTLIYKIYEKKIEINESVINDELNKLIMKNSFIEEYNVSEIEIISNNNKKDEIIVNEIIDHIKNQGFENTATKYSISTTSQSKGELGWISVNSLSKDIYEIVTKLKIGQISKPIKRQNSILFLKLKNKRKTKTDNINVAELKAKLIDQKKNEMFNLYSRSHLSKLRNTSTIEYK